MLSPSPIVPVILAGGSGTRLWPVSRDSLPKQFQVLTGTHTLYQQTLARVADRTLFTAPLVLTHEDFRFFARRQAAEIGIEATVALEPMRRDSGPALLAAALIARKLHGEACLVLALAADHVVRDDALFLDACREGARAAAQGRIVTFGITPTEPSTAYGYIRPGEPDPESESESESESEAGAGATTQADPADARLLTAQPATARPGTARPVAAFVEKPDAATAARYLAEGYLWNSGNFVFPAGLLIEEAARFEPAMVAAVREAVELATEDLGFVKLDPRAFAAAPAKSIDYAVMEHTRRAAVIEGRFRWSDVGAWDALHDLAEGDAAGNVARGAVTLLDTRNSYFHSDGPLLAGIGLDGVSVIATEDAVLVMPVGRAQDVKGLVARLKSERHNAATEHVKMHRPWGSYQTVCRGERFHVKKIVVEPGGRLSLQKHFHRAEHWIVVRGIAEVTLDGKVFEVRENESTYLPLGGVHRLANPGKIPLELIEVQTGSYLGEDDIVRIEDSYNRD